MSIGELEAIAAMGWWAPGEERLGGWLLRDRRCDGVAVANVAALAAGRAVRPGDSF